MNGSLVQIRSLLLAGLLALTAVPVAQAQPAGTPAAGGVEETAGPQFVLRPAGSADGSYIDLTLDAGASTDVAIVLANVDDEPIALRTFAADAFTLVNGGFGVRDDAAVPTAPTTWLTYEPATIDFGPSEGVERTVTISVPPGTAPGQYISGLVLQTAEALEIEGSGMFRQIVRKVIAVLITVPGPLEPGFTLGAPELVANPGATLLSVPVMNSGNVLVKPAGDLTLTGPGGAEVLRAPLQLGSVYAGDATTIELALPPGLTPGDYTVDVVLADEATSIEASLADATVTMPEGGVVAPVVTVASASLVPVPNDGTTVQYLDVVVEISNEGPPVAGGQLILTVERDGVEVERFPLATSLALPTGPTTVAQRYIPAEGWQPGTHTFALTLLAVDPLSGAESVLTTLPLDTAVDVP